MESQRRSEIYVGITVFIAILIVVIAVLWGKGVKISGETRVLTIQFNRVGGLSPGDVVNVSGVQVGRVSSLQIKGDSVQVRTKVSSDVDYQTDATASIESAELMGGKLVEVQPGHSGKPLPQGAIIRGTYAPGVNELASTLGNDYGEIRTILDDIRVVTSKLKEIFGGEQETQSIQATLKHIAATSKRLDSLVLDNSDALQASIQNLERSSTLLRNFMDSENDRAHRLLDSADKLSANLKTLADSTQRLVDRANSPASSVGRLLQNDTLYRQFEHSINSFDSLVTDFHKHPEKYLDKVHFNVRLF